MAYRAHGVYPPPQRVPTALRLEVIRYSDRGISIARRFNILRFIQLGWHPQAIADREGCHISVVYRVIHNLNTYGSLRAPIRGQLGRPSQISEEDGDALLDELLRSGWMYQDEIARWLHLERSKQVSQSTISRFLRDKRWSRHTIRAFALARSEDLRELYRRSLRRFVAEDLVFLDESIFNEKTGWRHKAYAPVGHEARYTQEIRRGSTWSILPAYTVNGYLPCVGIKEGYFNREQFLEWIREHLIPTIQRVYGPKPMVIVLDNVAIHTNDEVTEAIQQAGYIVRYLPPYSPDYNPIELTFSVLKAWIKRNFVYMRSRFDPGDFGSFLRAAITESRCDSWARKHFQHAAGGLYCEQEVLDRVRRDLSNERFE